MRVHQKTTTPLPELRPLEKQFVLLERTLQALGPQYARTLYDGAAAPDGYAGYVAVPKIGNFGMWQIPASSEAWGKRTGWKLHTRIKGMEQGAHSSFEPTCFTIRPETRAAFERLDRMQAVKTGGFDQNRLRVFPVRLSDEPEPQLRAGEFFLDLGSLIWLLITHHPHWTPRAGELFLRCLGERFGELVPLVGYRNLSRALQAVRAEDAHGITVIGWAA